MPKSSFPRGGRLWRRQCVDYNVGGGREEGGQMTRGGREKGERGGAKEWKQGYDNENDNENRDDNWR